MMLPSPSRDLAGTSSHPFSTKLCHHCQAFLNRFHPDCWELDYDDQSWNFTSLQNSFCAFCAFLRSMDLPSDPIIGDWDITVASQASPELDVLASGYIIQQATKATRVQPFIDKVETFKRLLQPLGKPIGVASTGTQSSGANTSDTGFAEEIHTRLVDVRNQCLVSVKLDECSYAALSYVWGRVKQLSLCAANREDLHRQNSLKERRDLIPATIRDAMEVCQQADIPFLWVDTLCIQQDSEDKALHIQNMHFVYSFAAVTIVAADSKDANQGLPGISIPRDFRKYQFDGIDEFPPLCIKPGSVARRLEASVWASRSWVLQESKFSRQMIVFSKEMCFAMRPDSIIREDGEQERDPHPRQFDSAQLQFSFMSQLDDSRPLSTLNSLLLSYVRRNLSFPDDIVQAFSGVMAAMRPLIGPFWHGIPLKRFLTVLCWRDRNSFVTGLRRPGFPSWSWAGWFHSRNSDFGWNSLLSTETDPGLPSLHGHYLPTVNLFRSSEDGGYEHIELDPAHRIYDYDLAAHLSFTTKIDRLEFRCAATPFDHLIFFNAFVFPLKRILCAARGELGSHRHKDFGINRKPKPEVPESALDEGEFIVVAITGDPFTIEEGGDFVITLHLLGIRWDGPIACRMGFTDFDIYGQGGFTGAVDYVIEVSTPKTIILG